VTAKAQEAYENESYAMRVWLLGLGLIGPDYALARKLLGRNLDGNSSWRYGKPEAEAATEAAKPEPDAASDEAATGATANADAE